MTAPGPEPLPPAVGAATSEPTFIGLPRPMPFRPSPEPEGPFAPLMVGGGGTMLFASRVPPAAPRPPPFVPVPPPVPPSDGGGGTTAFGPSMGAVAARVPLPPDTPADGGAITLAASDVPVPLRLPRTDPPVAALAATEGGGATTFGVSDVPTALLELPFALTEGGGATTSDGPKIFPMMLLISEPLPVADGGGGTTVLEGSGMLPLASRRVS